MATNELILRNPLRRIGSEKDDVIPQGGFGAVLAHAGVGKTALLVQLAINAMLRGKSVLHISLHDPVVKVGIWYQELFQHLARESQVQHIQQLWEMILPHRLILTYKVEGFSVPRLEERLTDLSSQGIFHPQLMIMDGLRFDAAGRQPLRELKDLAARHGMRVWFTVNTRAQEESSAEGMPVEMLHVADLFDIVLELQPRGTQIHIRPLKGAAEAFDSAPLLLDPSTMLMKG